MPFSRKTYSMIKKTICILTTAIFSLAAFSQNSYVSLKTGLNVANISITENGKYDDANALISFHVGISADLPISKYFSFQPGLLFTGKGAKTQFGESTDADYYKATSILTT